jgi:hypothetical protein
VATIKLGAPSGAPLATGTGWGLGASPIESQTATPVAVPAVGMCIHGRLPPTEFPLVRRADPAAGRGRADAAHDPPADARRGRTQSLSPVCLARRGARAPSAYAPDLTCPSSHSPIVAQATISCCTKLGKRKKQEVRPPPSSCSHGPKCEAQF